MPVVFRIQKLPPWSEESSGMAINWMLIFAALLLSGFLASPQIAAACDTVPAGQSFWIRLVQPVSSYGSKTGGTVKAILAESPSCDGQPILSVGTLIEGRITSVTKVGMGFRHETAAIGIDFDRILPANAAAVPIQAHILEVDNAREYIKHGRIYGIRSTATGQSEITLRLLHLPTWNPSTLWVVLAYRAAFPFIPEPEIYFPAGTDMRLALSAPLLLAKDVAPVVAHREFGDAEQQDLDQEVNSVSTRTTTSKGLDADIVNLAFIGSREQLTNAFQTAGWKGSDPLSGRAVLREIRAVVSLKNYPRLPMSHQLLDGKASDSMWQKSFNSFSKRDHLRIWRESETWQGQPVWFSASIREVGAEFSPRRRKFIHHVDVDLDGEREKVVRDLTLAGCVESVHEAPRSGMPRYSQNATGDDMRTDGAVAVVQLKDCVSPDFQHGVPAQEVAYRPRTRFRRYLRTQILSVRNLWRANIIYGAFDVGQMTVSAIRSDRSRRRESRLARMSQPAQADPSTSSAVLVEPYKP